MPGIKSLPIQCPNCHRTIVFPVWEDELLTINYKCDHCYNIVMIKDNKVISGKWNPSQR